MLNGNTVTAGEGQTLADAVADALKARRATNKAAQADENAAAKEAGRKAGTLKFERNRLVVEGPEEEVAAVLAAHKGAKVLGRNQFYAEMDFDA